MPSGITHNWRRYFSARVSRLLVPYSSTLMCMTFRQVCMHLDWRSCWWLQNHSTHLSTVACAGKVLDVVLQSHGSLRVTPKGSIHALHYDSSGTVLLQIAGQKVVTLIPQEQLPFTYPYPPGHVLARRAQINLTCRYNDVRFPLSQRLTPFQVILNPGDILVIAKHTPHETQSATDAVSLSLRLPF